MNTYTREPEIDRRYSRGRTPFKTAAFVHSAIPPGGVLPLGVMVACRRGLAPGRGLPAPGVRRFAASVRRVQYEARHPSR